MSSAKRNIRPIDVLDSKHVMAMILFLYENGPSRRVDIYDNISRNANMPEKIETLIGLGLIEGIVSFSGITFALSESGKAVANRLLSIESILKMGSGDREI